MSYKKIKSGEKVFISYTHRHSDAIFGEIIHIDLEKLGIEVTRDKTHIKTFDDIENFMQRVIKNDYLISLFSNSYFLSAPCMFEAITFMNEKNWKERVIPVVVETNQNYLRKIFNKHNTDYNDYWSHKHKKLEELIKKDRKNYLEVELHKISQIKQKMGEFRNSIINESLPRFIDLKREDYNQIHVKINKEFYKLPMQDLNIEKSREITICSGPVIINKKNKKTFLHYASSSKKWQFTGGRIDMKTSLLENAIKRTYEDLNLRVRISEFYEPLILYGNINNQESKPLILVHFLGEIEQGSKPTKGFFKWFSEKELERADKNNKLTNNILKAYKYFKRQIDIK